MSRSTPINVRAIWDEVRANQARLDACAGPHDFRPEDPPPKIDMRRYVCAKCGGDVTSVNKLWYDRGLEHAKAKT